MRPKLTHAQARDLMFAADLLLVDADEYEINARQRAVLRNSRSAIAAALEVQATRRAEREAAAEAARVERELLLVSGGGRRDAAAARPLARP